MKNIKRGPSYNDCAIFSVETPLEELKELFNQAVKTKESQGKNYTFEIGRAVGTYAFLISCAETGRNVMFWFTHYIHSSYEPYDKNYINFDKMSNAKYPYEREWISKCDIGIILKHIKLINPWTQEFKKMIPHMPRHFRNLYHKEPKLFYQDFYLERQGIIFTLSKLTYNRPKDEDLKNLR